jgi:hypothetical protein
MTEEIWLPIPDFDGYRASNLGRICSSRGILKQSNPFKKGYLQVHIRKWGQKSRWWRVNRLVCLAFHGSPPTPDHQAAHLNGNRANNRSGNLAWKTPLENVHDRFEHRTMLIGEKHPSAKLTLAQVTEIRERYTTHMRERVAAGCERPKRGFITSIAHKHGMGICAILMLSGGRTWADPNHGDSVEPRIGMRAATRIASVRYRANKRIRKGNLQMRREKVCPCCKREFGPEINVGGTIRQRIFDYIAKYPEGVTSRRIIDAVYADDPDGGPDSMNIVTVTVRQINKRIVPLGYRIDGDRGGVGSKYRLVGESGDVEQKRAARARSLPARRRRWPRRSSTSSPRRPAAPSRRSAGFLMRSRRWVSRSRR